MWSWSNGTRSSMIRRVAHNKFTPDSFTKVIRVLWARDVERGLAEIALRLTMGHPVLECRELPIDKISVLDSVGRVAKWRFLEDRLAWLWSRGYALIRNLTYLFNDLNKRFTETRRIASRKKFTHVPWSSRVAAHVENASHTPLPLLTAPGRVERATCP